MVAQVPSPRQKVLAVAAVPPFKFVTGRLPVTPLERSTCAHAGLLLAPVLERYLVAVGAEEVIWNRYSLYPP